MTARTPEDCDPAAPRPSPMRPTMRTDVVKVMRAGDDLAVVYNDWSMTAKRADGTPLERAGKALEIVRRQADGTWRFAIDDPFARG